MNFRIAAVLLACLLGACAQKQAAKPVLPEDCPVAYVVLPGNFIIDLAAGSEVVLNPAFQEFVLFCRRGDAEKALERERPALPGDWRVYSLEDNFADIAAIGRDGLYILDRPAKVRDWEAAVNPNF